MDKIKRRHYSKEERQKILEKTGCKCGHCGRELDTAEMTVEHIFPIEKGGKDDEFNLIALCKSCNYSKGNWLYKVKDYYKYILPEYIDEYTHYNEVTVHSYKKDKLINFDSVTYNVVPDKYKALILSMAKRGAKKKSIQCTIDKLTMKVIMDKAYEGDAEEIFSLISRLNDKQDEFFDTSLYSNVYAIRHDIKYGEAYVLRLNGNICGAVIFKKIKSEDIELAQLNTIEMNTRLRRKYVMTLACLSDIVCEILPDIMEDMYHTMIMNNAIPMYFNILSKLYKVDKDVISIPYTLDKVEGTLDFIHLKAIKDKQAEMIKNKHERIGESDLYTDDEIMAIAEFLLANTDDTSIDMNYIDELLSRNKRFSKVANLGDIR